MARITIKEVKKAFERWRKYRQGRTRVPLELRRLAIRLNKSHGQRRTIEELGVSSSMLWQWSGGLHKKKKWTKKVQDKSISKQPSDAAKTHKNPVRFLEIALPATADRSTSSASAMVIEWHRRDGCCMKATGSNIGAQELNGLVQGFMASGSGVTRI